MERDNHLIFNFSQLGMTVALTMMILPMVFFSLAAPAQTMHVIHSFNGSDGANPYAGLTMDGAGILYGTNGAIAYRLTPSEFGWEFQTIYTFDGQDGAGSRARLIFGPDGYLYGTNYGGGGQGWCEGVGGCGTVFSLRPPATICKSEPCPWTQTVLYRFSGYFRDGALPTGAVVFDKVGNLYGTTSQGGLGNCYEGCGIVYKLTKSESGWTETVIHRFDADGRGFFPYSELIFDDRGNLYGTTVNGGAANCGTVFRLTPLDVNGANWAFKLLYSFSETDGCEPFGGLVFGPSGHLYGTTAYGGSDHRGTVFELAPSADGWVERVLYSFPSGPGGEPYDTLSMDKSGNLYGTSFRGLNGGGDVFELSPSGGEWTFTSLHECYVDCGYPYSSVLVDAQGNLFGTSWWGGAFGLGSIWEWGSFSSPADWRQFRFDPSHTGYNPNEHMIGPSNVADLVVGWAYKMGGYPYSPSLADGLLYIGSDDGNLYALNATTGELVWTYQMNRSVSSTPVIANNVVYIGSENILYALKASDGTLLWQYAANKVLSEAATVVDGVIYFGAGDGVYALKASTGDFLWKSAETGYMWPPTVANGVVYAACNDGRTYAWNAHTGARLWKSDYYYGNLPVVVDDIVYLGSGNYNTGVVALRADTGAFLWQFRTVYEVFNSPAVANGIVYLAASDSHLYALNAYTGELVWSYYGAPFSGPSPVVANGVVYAVSYDGLQAVDASTGQLLWSDPSVYDPVIVANGWLYIGSLDDNLYAFHLPGH